MEDQDDATPVATSGEGIEEEGAGAPLQTEGVDVEAPADEAEALTQNEGVAVDDGQTTLAPPSTPPPREDGGAGAAERSLGADLSAIIDEELAGRRAGDREEEDVEAMYEQVLDLRGHGGVFLDRITSGFPVEEEGAAFQQRMILVSEALGELDEGMLMGAVLAGMQRSYDLRVAQGLLTTALQEKTALEAELTGCKLALEQSEILRIDLQHERDEAAEERDVALAECEQLRDELQEQRELLEQERKKARRSTVFDDLRLRSPYLSGAAEGGVVGSEGPVSQRRRRTTLEEGTDGVLQHMKSDAMLAAFFEHAKARLPGNQPVDTERLDAYAKDITEGDQLFAALAEAGGLTLNSRGALDAVLSPADLSKMVEKVKALVKAEKYQSRSDWIDMRDVNRKLSGIFSKPEVQRGVLSEALRVEEVSLVIKHWHARYNDAMRNLPVNDPKRLQHMKDIAEVRVQDQVLLAAALEALLAEHSAPLKEKIKNTNAGVTVQDLPQKGFAIMSLAVTCLDVQQVDKHVAAIMTIMEFPQSFEKRFYGNLATYGAELEETLERFELTTGEINKGLLYQLLLMDVMLTSKAKPMSAWRSHLVTADKFQEELYSLPKMSASFAVMFADACDFQKRNYTKEYHKEPLSLLEYEQLRPERTHFVRGDSAPVCPRCGKQHGGQQCLETANFQRVSEQADVVLRGAKELITQGQKLASEVAKHKDTGNVKDKIKHFVDEGEALITRFKRAMSFERNRYKAKTNVAKTDHDEASAASLDQQLSTHMESVQKATDAIQQTAQQVARQFGGRMQQAGVPPRTCWKWRNAGACANHEKGTCRWEHPAEMKGQRKTTARQDASNGDSAPAASGKSQDQDGGKDGPVQGTSCTHCGKFPKLRENGRTHNYCSKSCARAAGAFHGNPDKQAAHVGMLLPDVQDGQEDPAAQLMIAAGVVPLHLHPEEHAVSFMILSPACADINAASCSLSEPPSGVVLADGDFESFLQTLADRDLHFLANEPALGGAVSAGASANSAGISAGTNAISVANSNAIKVENGAKNAASRKSDGYWNIKIGNVFEVLEVEDPIEAQNPFLSVIEQCKHLMWAEKHKWEFPLKRCFFRIWRKEGKAARERLDLDYAKLRKLKWRARKRKKPGTVSTQAASSEYFSWYAPWSCSPWTQAWAEWRESAGSSRSREELINIGKRKLAALRARKQNSGASTPMSAFVKAELVQKGRARMIKYKREKAEKKKQEAWELNRRKKWLFRMRPAAIVDCIQRAEEIEFPDYKKDEVWGPRTCSALRVALTGGYDVVGKNSVRWTAFMKARERRAVARKRKRIRDQLEALRTQEKEKLSSEREVADEMMQCNLAWEHILSGHEPGFHWFADDVTWANQYWDQLEVLEEAKAFREKWERLSDLMNEAEAASEAAAVPDDVWEQLGLNVLGPSRWKEAVGAMSLQDTYTESRAQNLGVTVKHDDDPEQTRSDLERLRQWWPLCSASRISGMNLFETVQHERQRCFGQMQSGDLACEVLQKVLRCFKVTNPTGVALALVDSGSTCFLSPLGEHILVRFHCTTAITGIGQSTAEYYSPCVMGGVTSEGQYHLINYPRVYEMKSLEFPILSTPGLERCGYEFRLNSNFSHMLTPGGEIVPLVRDPGTGFHFFVDHLRAKPVLTRKQAIVNLAQERGAQPDVRFKPDDAEPTPAGPDTAEGVSELLRVNFGSECAWPAKSKTNTKSVGKHVSWGADQNVGQAAGAGSSNRLDLIGTVVWAKLGKVWWPACIQDPQSAPERIQDMGRSDQILVHFFDNWTNASQDLNVRQYRWMSEAAICKFEDQFDSLSRQRQSANFQLHVRIALGLCPGFQPTGWEAIAPTRSRRSVASTKQQSLGLGGASPGAIPAVDIDLSEAEASRRVSNPERYAPILLESETPPQTGDETGASETEGEVQTQPADEQYIRDHVTQSEQSSRNPIKMRLPAVKLVDTGVPEELADLRRLLHDLLAHFGDGLIREALPHLAPESLVMALKKVFSLPGAACAGCLEGKSKSEPIPAGKTARPTVVRRDEKVYLDMSGRIEEASVENNFHYYLAAIKSGGFAVVTGLSYKSQALLGTAKLFSKLGGAPKKLQIDNEGNLNTPLALNYLEGARECEVITTAGGKHFRNGKVERLHQTLKACVRAMLLHSGLDIAFWYHALQHAVLIYNLLSIARDEQDQKLPCTVWEHHYGSKPVLQDLLRGPFGCLAYLVLSEEQRRARNLSGHFGIRALAGVYLGCVFNPDTGVFDHMITDGRSIFSSPNAVKCIQDVYPMKFAPTREIPLIPHHEEDLLLTHEGEEISHARIYECCWVAAIKAKVTEVQAVNTAKSKGTGMKTKLKGNERMLGKNKKRPLKIVSEEAGGEAVRDLFKFVDEVDAEINLEDPRDYLVDPLREDFTFEQPYKDAKYKLVVPVDFSDKKFVPSETEHPHLRFVGRKIRRSFEVDDASKKRVSKSFTGEVLSYSPGRQLFKVRYDPDDDKEDLDFYELTQVLVMGKKWGDPPEWEGYTRAEQLQLLKQNALMREVREEVNCVLESRIDKAYESWYESEKEKMFRAVDQVLGNGELEVPVPNMDQEPIYDDEPKTEREVESHKECAEIRKAAWKEIQQLIDMSVGVLLDDKQARDLERDKRVQILRSKMVYKRKYQISPTDGKEYFLKWKARLAAVGCAQEPGVDTVWNTFSPTIGFTAIRTLIATMCNPRWHVDSYDLSGAYLGTKLEDQAVYMRLPQSAGEYSNKVLRLTRSIYGLRGASKAFMKQLGEEIEKFTENVEYKDAAGKERKETACFKRLITDQCMYRYKDAKGREMIFASYVDDIICCTTDLELRERFFDHLRKTWGITHEGTLDRFLGIHFERSKDMWSWSATMGTYIDKITKRFGLEDCRKVTTPMEPGFAVTAEDFVEEPTESMVTEMRSLIGSIGYCATAVRFDISHAVSVLSRHLARPCGKVIDAAKRIIKYLWWTRDFAIKWTASALEEEQGSANVIIGAVDASFAMDAMTRKSHGGFINFVNNGAVSWKSGLQSIVTLSSCEAEYVALCSEVCEVKYLRSLMRELGHRQEDSTLIWEDNKAAILIAENECSSAGRSKHIDVRFKFVAQAVSDGAIRVRYTPTDMNLADVLTKALPVPSFVRLVQLCLKSKSGEYFVRSKDETVHHEANEKTWLVTAL